MTDPDMGIWGYTYDALGNLQNQKRRQRQTNWLMLRSPPPPLAPDTGPAAER